jgi:DNA-binding transcriptional MerR regulator
VSNTYSISDLAQEFGVTTRTIRFYEDKGLLAPRRHGTRRIFSTADRLKLKLILRGRRLGFSLDESQSIAAVCDAAPTGAAQLQQWLEAIHQQQRQLQQQQEEIAQLQAELQEAEQRCREAITALDGDSGRRGHQMSLLEF